MNFAHRRHGRHGDVHPRNVLVSRGWAAKLADVGMAVFVDAAAQTSPPLFSAPAHAAPEVLSGGRPTRASDVFAFGVLLWEVASCAAPHAGVPVRDVPARVLRGARPSLDAIYAHPGRAARVPVDLVLLIEACWEQDPRARPTMGEVLRNLNTLFPTDTEANATAAAMAPGTASQPSTRSTGGSAYHLPEMLPQESQIPSFDALYAAASGGGGAGPVLGRPAASRMHPTSLAHTAYSSAPASSSPSSAASSAFARTASPPPPPYGLQPSSSSSSSDEQGFWNCVVCGAMVNVCETKCPCRAPRPLRRRMKVKEKTPVQKNLPVLDKVVTLQTEDSRPKKEQ